MQQNMGYIWGPLMLLSLTLCFHCRRSFSPFFCFKETFPSRRRPTLTSETLTVDAAAAALSPFTRSSWETRSPYLEQLPFFFRVRLC